MRTFYEGILAGQTKPRALQQAMLRVKNDYPHPYYWAPFILLGKS
jgi:CHAT domain-containing protein